MNDLGMLGNTPMIGPKADPRDYETVHCDKCGGIVFNNSTILKRISGVEVGQGAKPVLVPLPVLVCAKCGAILADDIKGYKLEEELKPKESEKKENNLILG